MSEILHLPVLVERVLELLLTNRSGRYLDGTCGLGGHAESILKELTDEGKLICIDRDVKMLQVARNRLQEHSDRVSFHHASYDQAGNVSEVKNSTLDGILLDLGICSAQLDDDVRGFSYRFDAPLDMRFDQQSGTTAEEYVNSVSSEELSTILRSYGDFVNPRKIVERIISRRKQSPLRSVGDLVSCVEDLFPRKQKNKLTARLLQCVRIAVNGELDKLDRALPTLVEFLKPGGRLAVISYHSQEDRRIKRFIRQSSRDSGLPPEIEACMKGIGLTLRSVTRRAVKAADKEVRVNPRARSARLRVAEKV
ncbi:MAG: 16S rRNA (cytosine(1402)-N(4))-methyltransferase RsmH [Candidatus Zixiibacteriota bacterium]